MLVQIQVKRTSKILGVGDGTLKLTDLKTERMKKPDFLHASTNAGRLKVGSVIFEWVLSKMAVAF